MNRGEWIQTYRGAQFFPFDPKPEDVHLEDIAHHLALICRFGGAVRAFYSVAQHSVHVSGVCPPYFAREGLLHDAAEAYIGDMVRGLKHSIAMSAFRELEERIEAAIAIRFGLQHPMPGAVKDADDMMLFTEARDLMAEPPNAWRNKVEPLPWNVFPWTPVEAEHEFLKRADELGIR
jgi:uncharacterized protein